MYSSIMRQGFCTLMLFIILYVVGARAAVVFLLLVIQASGQGTCIYIYYRGWSTMYLCVAVYLHSCVHVHVHSCTCTYIQSDTE